MTVAFAAALAMCALKMSQASTINVDGLRYLITAQAFVEGGLKAALAQFDWPMFPILIGLLHQAFGIAYESAAHTLNALLVATLSVGFVALYREVTEGKGRAWLAVAAILLSPEIANYRAYVVRDIGYWALSLWAVLYFLRYCRSRQWHQALAWQLCIVGAIAFRVEGLALAVLLPLWFWRGEQRSKAWLQTNSLFLLAAAAAVLLLATGVVPLPSNTRLEQLHNFLSPSRIVTVFSERAKIAAYAQGYYAPDDAALLLFGGVLYLLLHKVVTCLGWLYAPLLGWGLLKRRACLLEQPLIWFAAGITAIPLLNFAFNNLFLSGRYMGLLVLLLTLPTTRAAEALLFENGSSLLRPRWAAALALAALVMLLDAFIQTGPSKRYLREAGDWARDHLPGSVQLCSEDATLVYYAGRGLPDQPCPALERLHQQAAGEIRGAFLVKIGRKDAAKRERLETLLRSRGDLAIAAQFANKSGDSLYIVTAPPRR